MVVHEKTVTAADGHELGYVGPKHVTGDDYSAMCSVPGCYYESPTIYAGSSTYLTFRRTLKMLERHLERKHGAIQFVRTFPTRLEQKQRRRRRRLSRRGAARQLWRALLHR